LDVAVIDERCGDERAQPEDSDDGQREENFPPQIRSLKDSP